MPAEGGGVVIAVVPWWAWFGMGAAGLGVLSLAVLGVSRNPDRRLAEIEAEDPPTQVVRYTDFDRHVDRALLTAGGSRPGLSVRGDRRG